MCISSVWDSNEAGKISNSNFLFRILSISTILMIFSLGLSAQSVTSGLRGTVTDEQNAVVSGATVVLFEPSTKQSQTVVTDANGNYEFFEIKSGTYKITISKQGFSDFTAENALVENLQIRRIDAQLKVAGAGTNTVTVDAGAALITTEGGMIAATIRKEQVADTPTTFATVGPNNLFLTLPGVQADNYELKISGQSNAQQTVGLDGVINDRYQDQNNNINFYEEANITTVNATADNSRMVNANLVSKRGQNRFHGMVYYKRFDSTFNARDFFDYQEKKTYQLQHEGQAELSGPIWKNKTFFYASFFIIRIPTGSPQTPTVPSSSARAGDFSSLLFPEDPEDSPVYLKNPFSTSPCTAANQSGCLKDPSRATAANPTGLNIIPANLISPVSLKFQNYYPLPNLTAQGQSAYQYTHPFAPDIFKANFPFIRVDHNITSKNSIYGKFTKKYSPYVLPNGLPDFYWTRYRDNANFSVTDTHVFSPNLVNNFTFGFNRDLVVDGTETAKGYPMLDGNQAIADTGLQGANPGGLEGAGFPSININGLTSLSTVAGGVKNHDLTYAFEDNVNWSFGKHALKIGGNYTRFNTFTGEVPNYGTVTFNGNFTGSPYADFLLGIPFSSARVSPRINRRRSVDELGFYITDNFKISQKLTLDFGIRWDYYGLPTFKDGLQYNFDPATGDLIIAPGTRGEVDPRFPTSIKIIEGDVVPKADKGNFRPRIAAAYRFTDDFVLRGGYGAFTERFSRFYTDLAFGGGPFATSGENFNNSITNGVPAFTFPFPFLTDSSGRSPLGARSVSGSPLQNEDGIIHQYNVSLEKELFGLGFRTSYIGSRGQNLRAFVQLNAPIISASGVSNRKYQQYALNGVSYLRNDFSSSYNSVQFQVQKRRGNFTFDAHYTYAVSKNNINRSANPFTPTAEWAIDGGIRKNMFVASTTWQLPVGRGKQFLRDSPGIVDAVLGGWKLQTVTYLGSGLYITPIDCGNNNFQYGGNCIRPNINGDPTLSGSERTIENWYDASVFSKPAPGTYGNAPANSVEGPGLSVTHLSAAKTFTLKEIYKTTFTAGIGNLFNHPNFGLPYEAYTDGFTGLYYTLGNGQANTGLEAGRRVMYFKVRFEF